MGIISALLLAAGTWVAWISISLYRNYQICRKTGLPIVVSPTALLNPFWIIAYKVFPPIIPMLQSLPFGLGSWTKYTYMGWQYDDKYAIHRRLGPAFILCTPSINEVVLADPAAVHSLLARRKDFIKPAIMYDGLNAFGKNLDSVEGETWQRHRKITAPNFNERVSASVWAESIRQAAQMLHEWVVQTTCGEGTRDVVDDTASLTLNVFTSAGFGMQYEFRDAHSKVDSPHKLSYRDALYSVLRNFSLLAMLPMASLKSRVMPQSIRRVGEACDEFKLYMKEMVDREKKIATVENEGHESRNLLGALVRASQAEAQGLSDDELYGNLFIYNMAGHESTANTVATSIAYLAAAPHWQDWLREEIRTLAVSSALTYDRNGRADGWSYEKVYPHLKRCQAVMLETLRLHGSTVFLPKSTGNLTQRLTIAGKDHLIPPNTFVVANSQALHCDPKTWGNDALVWRPDRWIKTSDVGQDEELIDMPPGAFIGWAEGPRICPGKKFSQVEFAAVMFQLFRDHEVLPKQDSSESKDEAVERLKEMIDDSAITAITLQMKRPRQVALAWRKLQ